MKSHVSDFLRIIDSVYTDASMKCSANSVYDVRDLMTIRSRVKDEGMSFLTITLPQMGVDLERALAQERITPDLFRNFRKRLKVPAFLQGFFASVFDMGTGTLLPEPDVSSIEGLRQLAYTFKKVKLPCSDHRVWKALVKFEACESDLSEPLTQDDLEYFRSVSQAIWPEVLASGEFLQENFVPKHGPGATAEKILGNQKFQHRRWHERLEGYFPFFHFAYANEGVLEEDRTFENVTFVKGEDEDPVRVITVPKTLKTPRIIAIEPVCMQYVQQAVSKQLVRCLERARLTAGHVNFTSQAINRKLAIMASKTGRLATLDLSAASDRVPLSLSMQMFDSNPDLQGSIFACRSRRALLPNGRVITLKKFASMGSALCFPVEAMYFYTLCVGSLLRNRALPVTRRNVERCSRHVYVYGDDIIVPANEAEAVAAFLQRYYCKVGRDKSFWTGRFRESCGMDAYAGEEVTPTYIRTTRPCNRHNGSEILSWIATSNLFYEKGYWRTADLLQKEVSKIIGELPIISRECPGLGLYSFQPAVSIHRWGKQYQRPEIRAWVASPVYRTDKLTGYAALTKSLLKLHDKDNTSLIPTEVSQKDHLARSARYGAVALKRRWTSPI